MEHIFTTEHIASFITLTLLEIVLGIDNLIFVALVADKLPKEFRKRARLIGLSLALVIRVLMLMGASWIMSLTEPLFTLFNTGISFKDLLLLGGGLFLIAKSTLEMHADVADAQHKPRDVRGRSGLVSGIAQIVFIDFIFSFDSIITAVGLTQNIPIIVAAVVISMGVMIAASGYISQFLEQHPTFKVLALAFILMIGMLLMAEGMHLHIPRGYLYFAFGFSLFVEGINTAVRKKRSTRKEP